MSGSARADRTAQREARRFPAGERGVEASVRVAIEAPLELRVAGDLLAVTLRTPGEDEELALGFLLSEGLIRDGRDVARVARCGPPGAPPDPDVLDVLPAPGIALPLTPGHRRGTLVTGACGLCGRAALTDLLARVEPNRSDARIPRSVVAALPAALRAGQASFESTGGTHAAALAGADGRLLVVREDVGRHNAVDKALGQRLVAGFAPPLGHILVLSGRVGFELVQKAAVAEIPVVVAVSAPTSLALEAAARLGVTVVAFTRADGFTAYTHPERIVDED